MSHPTTLVRSSAAWVLGDAPLPDATAGSEPRGAPTSAERAKEPTYPIIVATAERAGEAGHAAWVPSPIATGAFRAGTSRGLHGPVRVRNFLPFRVVSMASM